MSEPAAEPLRLAVLGQVRAAGPDGALLPVTGLGANLLLALALEPRGLSSARAVEETWPDGAPASGRAALQTLVSRLRGAHPGLLASTAAGYALGVGRGTDLVLYLMVIAMGFLTLNTYLRFRSLEKKLTDLARTVAITEGVRHNSDRLDTPVGSDH